MAGLAALRLGTIRETSQGLVYLSDSNFFIVLASNMYYVPLYSVDVQKKAEGSTVDVLAL